MKLVAVQQHVVTVYINNLNIFKLLLTVNGIVNLPYLRDFVPPQLGAESAPSIFSFFFKLCQQNLVRGNNVQKRFKMWKKL